MKAELYNYEIFPAAFLCARNRTVTVRPLGVHAAFAAGGEYTVCVLEAERSSDRRYPGSGSEHRFVCVPDADGCLRFTFDFPREGMYLIQFIRPGEEKSYLQLRVYALAEDMRGRIPRRGDLHMHSCRSDGREDPNVVAANYRGHGYDFTVISDHRRYYPSLETRRTFRIDNSDESPLTDFLVVPGEEIHLPYNDAHFVNFGGKYSINALVVPNANEDDRGRGPEARSLCGECPEPMTKEEYCAMIDRLAADIPLELESERRSLAALRWISAEVRKAGGLGIFPHPYWLTPTMQISETFLRTVYEDGPFDAFEVLGGESYYQHNGFQTGFYYEMKAKGITYPVVGSTDSHGSTEHNRNALVCSTIVFSPANRTDDLIDSVKKGYSVAVDSISKEYRLVGDFRWIKYGSFLMENWYPLHDLICEAEGTYLKRFALGDADAERVLTAMKGEIPAMERRFFDLEA